MKLSQFEKVQKLYERVKELDAQIIEIENMAALIARGNVETKLSLKVMDLDKKEKESSKVKIDDDGSLIFRARLHDGVYNPLRFLLDPYDHKDKESEKKYDAERKETISENSALQILGVLLSEKMEQRNLAIKALNKNGIEI